MQMSELAVLLTPEALRLVDEIGPLESTDAAATAVSRLRARGHSPDLVAAVVSQARLRTRAVPKFGPFASRMLFTRAGLEQSTRLEVAAHHAARFRRAGLTRVADLGCGIGGDSSALAALGLDVLAVDADEATAAVAAYNLAPFGAAVTVAHARAEDTDLSEVDGVWLDPARRDTRNGESTRVGASDWSPSLDWVFGTLAERPGGAKLGPALDHDLIPAGTEAQWVSVDGATIELVVWSGVLARPGITRSALVIRGGQAHELAAPTASADAEVRELGSYLHEPEGAVIRARLIGEVARSLDAGMLAPGIAYLTSDAAASSPFAQSFRVREVLPFETKKLARSLRERDIGTLEIKKRGVDVDPAALRTKLSLRGTQSATLILTRINNRRLAVLADRVDATDASD